ncbi:hypothetical protein ETB97_002775 [Aspergillus alliaceus]|uniref:Uncharacterized protein n=1 Tax=Petromyces alliaceus TaxID=209559 RepID=A0A8H6A3N2_PETAA|nr:hypothetical protein ETB97_002775 [Aspergillus burnettii]
MSNHTDPVGRAPATATIVVTHPGTSTLQLENWLQEGERPALILTGATNNLLRRLARVAESPLCWWDCLVFWDAAAAATYTTIVEEMAAGVGAELGWGMCVRGWKDESVFGAGGGRNSSSSRLGISSSLATSIPHDNRHKYSTGSYAMKSAFLSMDLNMKFHHRLRRSCVSITRVTHFSRRLQPRVI